MASSAAQKPPSRTIRNPRRLLILTPSPDSLAIIPPLLHSLTGVPVTDPPTKPTASPSSSATATPSFAGYTTHSPLHLQNKYYTADIPIWVDEIPVASPQEHTQETPDPDTERNPEEEQQQEQPQTPQQWRTEFSSPEAQVVRDAIGSLIICVRSPEPDPEPVPLLPSSSCATSTTTTTPPEERADVQSIKTLLRAIADVKGLIDEERGGVGDVPGLIVFVGRGNQNQNQNQGQQDKGLDYGDRDGDGDGLVEEQPFSELWWEDQLFEMGVVGFEVVKWDPKGGEEEEKKNQFGEFQGMRRIKEVLETHDWTTASSDDPEGDGAADDLERELLGLDEEEGGEGFKLEVNELEREMMGLRFAIERGGGDGEPDEGEGEGEDDEGEIRVDSLEGLMLRMQAIKDMSAELPENERKRFAAKAVHDIMKEV